MDISPILKVIAALESEAAAQPPLELQPGERLTGRVLKIEEDGRMLVDLGRARVMARTELNLKVGQEILLRVTQTGIPVQLSLEGDLLPGDSAIPPPFAPAGTLTSDEMTRALKAIERLLAGPALRTPGGPAEAAAPRETALPDGVRHALLQLKALFAPIDPQAPAAQQAAVLRSALEDRGLLFEIKLADALVQETPRKAAEEAPAGSPETLPHDSRLSGQPASQMIKRDLKAQLLVLKVFFEAPENQAAIKGPAGEGPADDLRRSVTRLLSHVERHQQEMARRSSPGEAFQVLHHLLPLKDHIQPLRLKVYYPSRGRRGMTDPGHRIAVLLDMDRLGPVRVDLSLGAGRLSIQFYVRDRQVADDFERCTPEMADALGGLFNSIQITTHVSPLKSARFAEEDRTGGAFIGRIDLHA